MLVHNTAEALGVPTCQAFEAWQPHLSRLEAVRRPALTDNQLHAWEWLESDGRVYKTDAIHHHAAHDLVGPQDIAWDIAGAAIEFHLGASDLDRLVTLVEGGSGRPVDRDLLTFMRAAYSAFQHGRYIMGRTMSPKAEQPRVQATALHYKTALSSCLDRCIEATGNGH
jgi:hypothetical protein